MKQEIKRWLFPVVLGFSVSLTMENDWPAVIVSVAIALSVYTTHKIR